MESGVIPSDAVLTENGDVPHVFSESADCCGDLGNLVPDIADSSRSIEPEPGANSIPIQMSESIEPAAEDANEERKAVLSWEEVEITFLSDERVQIATSRNRETRNYSEFGFEDGRSGKPKQAWIMLRALANVGGVLRQPETGSDWPKVEKRIQELRSVLRNHFNLDDDPLPFKEAIGYEARFRISIGPSFNT